MGLSDMLSENLSKFEKYNAKEIYRIGKEDSFNFIVTGRLVSGAAGFFVIIIMLILTFSSAANSYQVAGIGGIKAFTADVIITQQTGPTPLTGDLDEGESVNFGHLVDDVDWDYLSNLRISHFEVVVDWQASGGVGAGGGRQVTFDVSSQGNSSTESENDGGPDGIITIPWQINSNISLNSELVSGNADTAEEFLLSFEEEGDWMGGTFTFTQASAGSIIFDESVDYEISLSVYTWELENIREIAEV